MNINAKEISYITVNVHGPLRIPLHLDLLKNLEDSALEEEIVKESIKIAINEHLGWSNHLDITFGSCKTSGSSTERATTQVCEANISLEDLGIRIKAIQAAYDNVIQQAATLKDLLSLSQQEQEKMEEKASEKNVKEYTEDLNVGDAVEKVGVSQAQWNIMKERDAVMLTLLESVLGSPTNIIDAACQIENEDESLRSVQGEKLKQGSFSSEKPLLEGNSWQSNDNFHLMTNNETTMKDYTSMGYMPL
ncbi:unnamed protein product [Phytomonas sp. Hart1]|nr:unnamed protein product [Phytomonas sp. Hart1]|eukprot:CCW70332.1 unnamed protein product [Phytomonas sp. isolate Hart1]